MNLIVEIRNTTRRTLPVRRLRAFAEGALRALKLSGELSISFVGARLITRLNREYLGRAGDTDVLSFAQNNLRTSAPPHFPTLLGDVVICVPRAFADAKNEGVAPVRHLETLILHGILHLAGHDHETAADHKKMVKEEEKVWQTLKTKTT